MLAPDFSLESDEGATVTLSELRGRWVVLFFYPKDDTPGCTVEACEFRDAFPRFGAIDAVVLGISPDDAKSHRKFRAKFALPYPLLADVGHKVASRYTVWKRKTLFGLRYMGVERTTFLIGPGGEIVRRFEKVKPAGHAAEVEAAIAEARAKAAT